MNESKKIESAQKFATQYPGYNPALVALTPMSGGRALDVGCGCGGNAIWLTQRGSKVDGITWDEAEAVEAAKVCHQIYKWDLNAGLPEDLKDNSYSLVLCSHILEHIAYPEKLIEGIRRVLTPDGVLVVAVPNLLFWQSRLKLLLGNWQYEKSGTFDYTHLRWYTKNSMIALMRSHGLAVQEFRPDGWVPLPGLRRLIGVTRRENVNAALARKWPGLFGWQLMFKFVKHP